MPWDPTILSFLDTVAFIQGLTLGTLLLLLNRKNYRPTFFLGIFLLMFTLEKLPAVLGNFNFWDHYPGLYLLPLNHTWLLFPVFFIYSQKVSIFSTERIRYHLLYPGLIVFLFQTVVFFLPMAQKQYLVTEWWYQAVFTLGNLYAIYVAFLNLGYLKRHRSEVGNHFASLELKELKWAHLFVVFGILFYTASFIGDLFIADSAIKSMLLTVVNFITIYWLSFHGTMQYSVERILLNPSRFGLQLPPLVEDTPMPSIKEEQVALVDKINAYISNSEAFIHSELTIVELGNSIGVHPRRISTAINSVCNQNFNAYINQFRIKRALELLSKKEKSNLSIEGIGLDVGFNSKSAFYSAFKKETGSTPTRYKEKIEAQP